MKVFHDDGRGSTDESVEFFEKLLPELRECGFTPIELSLDFGRLYSFELLGVLRRDPATPGTVDIEDCVVLLTGVNCGYGGTGPDGTVRILALLNGVDIHHGEYLTKVDKDLQEAIRSERHLRIDFKMGVPKAIPSRCMIGGAL